MARSSTGWKRSVTSSTAADRSRSFSTDETAAVEGALAEAERKGFRLAVFGWTAALVALAIFYVRVPWPTNAVIAGVALALAGIGLVPLALVGRRGERAGRYAFFAIGMEELSWGQRRVDLPAGRYDTILPPSAVADLMIDAYWYAGARVAHEGQSVYSSRTEGTRIGETIARPGVNLWSDPTAPGLECVPFVVVGSSDNEQSVFDNGLPIGRNDWILGLEENHR